MRAIQQTTLAKPVALSGVGVHSAAPVEAVLRPAGADSGVVFRLEDGALIMATAASITDTRFSTTLGSGGRTIATVEHLLAALAITGVDNLLIDVDAGEMPILDGSAAPFVEAIDRAGLKHLAAARTVIRVIAPIEVTDGERSIRAEPHEGRLLDIAIRFEDAAIGAQALTLNLDHPGDLRRLAEARTFCRLAEVTALRAAGFSRGGSLDNAIVVDGGRVLNPAGLRDPAEFALHKALDLVGDLRLAGAPILARISAVRPGHDLNARFIDRLMSDHAASERVIMPSPAAMASG